MARSFGMPEIVTPKTLIEVFTRSYIPATGFAAAQDINVKHGERSLHRAGGIRTHDLLNPIQAFYQAELRPAEANTVAISGCEANISASANDSSH